MTGQVRCLNCGEVLPGSDAACIHCESVYKPRAPHADASRVTMRMAMNHALGIRSIMATTAILAVCVAWMSNEPVSGIPCSVVFFLAWMRTTVFNSYRAARGAKLDGESFLIAMVGSVFVSCLVLGCASFAFFAALTPVALVLAVAGHSGEFAIVPLSIGMLASISVAIYLLVKIPMEHG